MRVESSKLLVWGSDVDQATILQAGKASRLPIIEDHIALMPDAHVGIGATVGSGEAMRDDDIGRCDDCGSEEGDRMPIARTIRTNGLPMRVRAWLCKECQNR